MKTPVFIAISALSTLATPAFSHEGHGLGGFHWHPTDAWGFVALVLAVGAAIWLGRGGK